MTQYPTAEMIEAGRAAAGPGHRYTDFAAIFLAMRAKEQSHFQATPEAGCYCIDRCMAPSVMGRQTRCLRNPPLRPGQVIEPPASDLGKAKP